MLKVGFEFVTDASQFIQSVDEADRAMGELRKSNSKFSTESKAAFDNAATEAENMRKGIGDAAVQTGKFNEEVNKLGKTKNAVQQLKQEIKFYTAEAYKAGVGTKAFKDNLEKAGKLKDDLADLNAQVKSLSGNMGENFARAAGNSIGLVSKGFEGLTALQVLAGQNNKAFEETLLKLQSLNALSSIATEFAGIGDKITEITLGFKGFADNVVSGFKKVAAAAAANPFTAIAVALTVLVAIFVAFKDSVTQYFDTEVQRLNKVLFLQNSRIAALKDEYAYIQKLNEANGSNSIQKQIDANKRISAELQLRLKALHDLSKRAELTDEQLKLASETELEIETLRKENAILEIQRKKQQYDLAKEVAQNNEALQISQIKDAESRDLATLQFKKQMELEAYKEKVKYLYDGELADAMIKKQSLVLEAAYQKDYANLQLKYSQARIDMMSDLTQKFQQSELEKADPEKRIKLEKKYQIESLQLLKDDLQRKGEETFKNFKFSKEQLKQFKALEYQIEKEASDKLIALKKEASDKLIALKFENAKQTVETDKESLVRKLEIIDLETQAKTNLVNAQRKPKGLSDEQFEKMKSEQILEIRLEAAVRSIDIKKKEVDDIAKLQILEAQNEITLLKARGDNASLARAEALQTAIGDIQKRADAEKNVIETEFAALFTSISNEIDKINSGKKVDLQSLLGLDDKQYSLAKSAFQQTYNAYKVFTDSKMKEIDKEISKNQELINSRQKNIDNLNNQLQQEYQLRADGSASNISLLEQELAQEEAAKQMALANDQKLKQQREKLARQQLITDTITQGSNLLVASSQIFATTAKDPVTTAIAAITVAAMIAAFAKTKSDAFKAVNENNFAEGVIDLKGPGTETSDSIPANLSKGESVMTARETRENKRLFLGIREEDDRMITAGIMDLIRNRGISLIPDLTAELVEKRSQYQRLMLASTVPSKGLSEVHLETMNKKFDALLKQNSSKTYTDAKGNLIIQQGSHIRIVRNG